MSEHGRCQEVESEVYLSALERWQETESEGCRVGAGALAGDGVRGLRVGVGTLTGDLSLRVACRRGAKSCTAGPDSRSNALCMPYDRGRWDAKSCTAGPDSRSNALLVPFDRGRRVYQVRRGRP